MKPHIKKRGVIKQRAHNAIDTHVRKLGANWSTLLKLQHGDVTAMKPDRGNVFVDLQEGRYRLSHKCLPGARKSVSWQRRGHEAAVKTSLRMLWQWDNDATGSACPIPEDCFAC